MSLDNLALERLLDAFHREAGIEADGALAMGAGFSLHGVGFCFHCNEAWPDFLTLYCEFGHLPDLPDRRREQAWQALLEANLVLAHQGAMQQSFALDPGTGAVIAVAHQPVAELDVIRLREWLADLAEQAMAWRADYFLSDEDAAPMAAAAPAPPPPPHWLARLSR